MGAVDRVKIRASYNGGFTVVRGACGILGKTGPEWQAAHEAMRNLRVQYAPGRIARSVARAFAAFR